MAEKKNPEVQQPAVQAETYDAAEIAENAQRLFGYSPDIAATALELAGVKTCTLAEAKEIIKAFAEGKVN